MDSPPATSMLEIADNIVPNITNVLAVSKPENESVESGSEDDYDPESIMGEEPSRPAQQPPKHVVKDQNQPNGFVSRHSDELDDEYDPEASLAGTPSTNSTHKDTFNSNSNDDNKDAYSGTNQDKSDISKDNGDGRDNNHPSSNDNKHANTTNGPSSVQASLVSVMTQLSNDPTFIGLPQEQQARIVAEELCKHSSGISGTNAANSDINRPQEARGHALASHLPPTPSSGINLPPTPSSGVNIPPTHSNNVNLPPTPSNNVNLPPTPTGGLAFGSYQGNHDYSGPQGFNRFSGFNSNVQGFNPAYSGARTSDFSGRPVLSHPISPQEQQKYDEFLQREAYYARLDNWDHLPSQLRLFIGNLPTKYLSKVDIFRLFGPYGDLLEILARQGYGFIQYSTNEAVQRCVQGETGVPLFKRILRFDPTRPFKRRNPHSYPQEGHERYSTRERGLAYYNEAQSNYSSYNNFNSTNYPSTEGIDTSDAYRGNIKHMETSAKEREETGIEGKDNEDVDVESEDDIEGPPRKKARQAVEDAECTIFITAKSSPELSKKAQQLFSDSKTLLFEVEDITDSDLQEAISDTAYSGAVGACVVKESTIDVQTFEKTEDGGVRFDEYANVDASTAVEILERFANGDDVEEDGSDENENENEDEEEDEEEESELVEVSGAQVESLGSLDEEEEEDEYDPQAVGSSVEVKETDKRDSDLETNTTHNHFLVNTKVNEPPNGNYQYSNNNNNMRQFQNHSQNQYEGSLQNQGNIQGNYNNNLYKPVQGAAVGQIERHQRFAQQNMNQLYGQHQHFGGQMPPQYPYGSNQQHPYGGQDFQAYPQQFPPQGRGPSLNPPPPTIGTMSPVPTAQGPVPEQPNPQTEVQKIRGVRLRPLGYEKYMDSKKKADPAILKTNSYPPLPGSQAQPVPSVSQENLNIPVYDQNTGFRPYRSNQADGSMGQEQHGHPGSNYPANNIAPGTLPDHGLYGLPPAPTPNHGTFASGPPVSAGGASQEQAQNLLQKIQQGIPASLATPTALEDKSKDLRDMLARLSGLG